MRRSSACFRVLFLLLVVSCVGLGARSSPPAAHAQAVERVAGLWAGTWESTMSPQFGSLSLKLQQTGAAFTGTVTMANAVMCGATLNVRGVVEPLFGQIASGSLESINATTGNVRVGHCTMRFNGKLILALPSGRLWAGTYAASGPSGTLDEGTFAITTVGSTTGF